MSLILNTRVATNDNKNITKGIMAKLECKPPALLVTVTDQPKNETMVIDKLTRNLLLYILTSTILMIIYLHITVDYAAGSDIGISSH